MNDFVLDPLDSSFSLTSLKFSYAFTLSIVAIGVGVCLRLATRPSVEQLEIDATLAWNNGSVFEAEELAREALGRSSEAARARQVLSQVAEHDSNPLLAVAALLSVPKEDSQAAESCYLAAEIAYQNDFATMAEQACLKSLECDPNYALAYERLLGLAVARLESERVRELLMRRAHRLSNTKETIRLLLTAESLDNEASKFEPMLRQFLNADPNDQASRVALAHGLNALQRHQEAVQVIEPVAHMPEARVVLAKAKWSEGNFAEALALMPDEPPQQRVGDYWALMGSIALSEGRIDDAVRSLARSVKLRPLNREIRARYCEVLRLEGNDSSLIASEASGLKIVQEIESMARDPAVDWNGETIDELMKLCASLEAAEYLAHLREFRSRMQVSDSEI